MAVSTALGISRHFTKPETQAYDMLNWVKVDSLIANPMTGEAVFEQKQVEFPDTWSLNAINIVAQKYFWGTPGTKDREKSLKELVGRVADTITRHGLQEGYFEDEVEADTFNQELKYILSTQRASFNSPVWFNIGAPDRAQQASACFILAVDDTMPAILNWYKEEGMIFKGGSGSGINLSTLRSSAETLSKSGGTASGPMSFMRGADASAGAIKSGGKTRRAAKMVILNVDHPDVEEFIWSKALEERKSRVLQQNGFDMSLNGSDAFSVQYQNANNSVRVTDDFMEALEADADWDFKAVTTGEKVKTTKAKKVMRQIAEAAWECADPGMQYDTTINDWHTTPNAGRINGSNPCSEYMHLDNSACNLASLNLLTFLNDDGSFDVESFKHTTEIIFTAQEILVGYSEYPTENITKNARAYRELGIGYANLGALLMAMGLPYDSDEGRALAATITAMLTGNSYATSAKIAKRVGPFAGYKKDKDGMNRVLKKHRAAVNDIDAALVPEEMLSAAVSMWDEAVELGKKHGVRNSQASVLAPTGTIGLMMDCDTTGIEPDLALVKTKNLVGGGVMSIVNQTVPRALATLGYNPVEIKEIEEYIDTEKTIVGAPFVKEEHMPVFACAMGDNVIHYNGHIKMMGAVQPFLSGAISKTVNMPEEVTVEDVEQLYIDSWKLGLKAVAIYRDNCKVAQPLSTTKKEGVEEEAPKGEATVATAGDGYVVKSTLRRKMPKVRNSKTFQFTVADLKGYFIVGEFEDGQPGELFIWVAKQGSTLSGVMDSFGRSVSYGLQYGVPLKAYVKGMTNLAFAPSGITDDPDIRTASSLMDYIFRRLALDYLSFEDRLELGLASLDDMPDEQTTLLPEGSEPVDETPPPPEAIVATTATASDPVVEAAAMEAEMRKAHKAAEDAQTSEPSHDKAHAAWKEREAKRQKANSEPEMRFTEESPLCVVCGNRTQRSGSCYVCTACGTTTGCS